VQQIPRNTILHENPSSNGPIGGPGNSREGEPVSTSCSQHEVLAQRCWFSRRDNLQPRKASILIGGGILYFSPSPGSWQSIHDCIPIKPGFVVFTVVYASVVLKF